MGNTAIVGINWGDEGKGRMVDLIARDYDVVVRYQGGGNAGHTVVNEKGKFALHLIPSGIFQKGTVNVIGNGVALDPENLWKEIEELREKGVEVTPENLKISSRASLLLPWHRALDALEEARLKDRKYGSTKQGIAPFYSAKPYRPDGGRASRHHPSGRACASAQHRDRARDLPHHSHCRGFHGDGSACGLSLSARHQLQRLGTDASFLSGKPHRRMSSIPAYARCLPARSAGRCSA